MTTEGELTREFDLADLAEDETTVEIVADEAERTALAARFGLLAVEALAARLTIARAPGGRVRIAGRLSAEVVQRCVVSLEPVAQRIDEDFSRIYGPPGIDEGVEVTIDIGAGDMIEPLSGDILDLGEIVAEQFGLSIEPYPRKARAEFLWNDPLAGSASEEGGDSPFAVLRTFKPRS